MKLTQKKKDAKKKEMLECLCVRGNVRSRVF